MNAIVAIRPDLKTQLGSLATEMHRSESELVNEALESYLQRTQLYIKKLKQRVAEADAGQFATEEEMEKFFLTHSEPD
ncbi:MAG: CopG family transcriptional regulator [Gallionella sp.]|jgi:predicted transcriptional regulator|nr:CopG family transcriptional regulator [Gallionella sp.]